MLKDRASRRSSSFTFFRRKKYRDSVIHMGPLGCISKLMRYACLDHLEGMSIKLLLSRELFTLDNYLRIGLVFTATTALHSLLCSCIQSIQKEFCALGHFHRHL